MEESRGSERNATEPRTASRHKPQPARISLRLIVYSRLTNRLKVYDGIGIVYLRLETRCAARRVAVVAGGVSRVRCTELPVLYSQGLQDATGDVYRQ